MMGQPHHVGLHEAIGWTLAFCEMGSFCMQCYYDRAHTFIKVSLVLAALSCRDRRGQSGKQGDQLGGPLQSSRSESGGSIRVQG